MLGELLDSIRSYYLKRLGDARDEIPQSDAVHVQCEVVYRSKGGEAVQEGALKLPMREDIAVIEDGAARLEMIDTEKMLSFEPIDFLWPDNGLEVTMNPFQWNWLPLKIHDLPDDVNWQPLVLWFRKWFKDGQTKGDKDEWLGAVHFMGDPEQQNEAFLINIDLGSAPVEAFEELLDAVGELGADRLTIGS